MVLRISKLQIEAILYFKWDVTLYSHRIVNYLAEYCTKLYICTSQKMKGETTEHKLMLQAYESNVEKLLQLRPLAYCKN